MMMERHEIIGLMAELKRYPQVSDIRFVQDEPINQGPWPFMALNLPPALEPQLERSFAMTAVARPEASSPSVGLHKVHVAQEKDLLNRAFEGI